VWVVLVLVIVAIGVAAGMFFMKAGCFAEEEKDESGE
jgi:uncharacterized membrane protein